MYLRDCHVESCGPICSIDLSPGFDGDNPNPLLLVGENGAGKTVLMSMVADALALFGQRVFEDIIPGGQPAKATYLRYLGPLTQRPDSPYSLGLLHFTSGVRSMYWHEKTGTQDVSLLPEPLRTRFSGATWPTDKNSKEVWGDLDEQDLRTQFGKGVHVFFTANRGEEPIWLNSEAIRGRPRCELGIHLSKFSSKPIVVESSQFENMNWLMDVILDGRIEVVPNDAGGYTAVDGFDTIGVRNRQKHNVERILGAVLRNNLARLAVAPRTNQLYRLCVTAGSDALMPSLAGLSAGEASLFNIFCTILRYGDASGSLGGPDLGDIDGLVLIDEVDAHLHTDLQYQVLPTLLHMFPRIQFIISTHSPWVLLGMEKEYGRDDVQILAMPSGQLVSAEEFSEFQASLLMVSSTSEFRRRVTDAVTATTKPLVLVEGETDVRLIGRALEVLGRDQFLDQMELTWVGSKTDGEARGGGKDQLYQVQRFLVDHSWLSHRRVLLLYDSDANKTPGDFGLVSVRSLPKNAATTKVGGGIENLFSDEVLEDRFFEEKCKPTNNGKTIVSKIKKREFCDYACESLTDRNAFSRFEDVAVILEEFVRTTTVGT